MAANNNFSGEDPFPPGTTIPSKCALAGFAALLRAYNYARDAGSDLWDFALEIDELYALGLTISEVRWLVAWRFVEHATDQSACGDPHRTFDACAGFSFDPKTCLVLTAEGAAFAARFVASVHQNGSGEGHEPAGSNGNGTGTPEEHPPPTGGGLVLELPPLQPRWDAARRELYYGDALVKRFRVPARNQELILAVFEEDDWPEFIDDPLPQSHDICPKTRLHDAIHRLNGHQARGLLRFHGNGNGLGVYWEALSSGGVGVG